MKFYDRARCLVALLCVAISLCLCACQAKETTKTSDNGDLTPVTTATTVITQPQAEPDDVIDRLMAKVDDSIELRLAVDPAAVSDENIAFQDYWTTNVSATMIESAQPSTFAARCYIADATWDNGMVKPADPLAIDVQTGTYIGDMVPAVAKEDYIKFTVWFRSTEADKTVRLSGNESFVIKEGAQELLPAATLLIDNGSDDMKIFTNESFSQGGDVCVCSQKIGEYYVGNADFYIYIDGTHSATINQNTGVDLYLEQLAFEYAD